MVPKQLHPLFAALYFVRSLLRDSIVHEPELGSEHPISAQS